MLFKGRTLGFGEILYDGEAEKYMVDSWSVGTGEVYLRRRGDEKVINSSKVGELFWTAPFVSVRTANGKAFATARIVRTVIAYPLNQRTIATAASLLETEGVRHNAIADFFELAGFLKTKGIRL
jgi:hypothetical protein